MNLDFTLGHLNFKSDHVTASYVKLPSSQNENGLVHLGISGSDKPLTEKEYNVGKSNCPILKNDARDFEKHFKQDEQMNFKDKIDLGLDRFNQNDRENHEGNEGIEGQDSILDPLDRLNP